MARGPTPSPVHTPPIVAFRGGHVRYVPWSTSSIAPWAPSTAPADRLPGPIAGIPRRRPHRLQPGPRPRRVREHLAPVDGLAVHQSVARLHVRPHEAGQPLPARTACQVGDPNAPSRRLVLVARSDTAGGRVDALRSAALLREALDLPMVGQDDVGPVAHQEAAVEVDPLGRQPVQLREERPHVNDHPVADHAGDAGMQDAGRIRCRMNCRPPTSTVCPAL